MCYNGDLGINMKTYNQDLRDRVISKYKTGKYQIIELAQIFNITGQTISNWLKRYRETGDYSSRHHLQKGRSIKFNDRDKVMEYIERNPNSDGITIRNNVAPGLAMSPFYDSLAHMKITYKKKSPNIRVVAK